VTCTFLDANPVLRAIGRPMTMRAAEQHGDAWTPNCRLPGRAIRQALQPFSIHRRNANVASQALHSVMHPEMVAFPTLGLRPCTKRSAPMPRFMSASGTQPPQRLLPHNDRLVSQGSLCGVVIGLPAMSISSSLLPGQLAERIAHEAPHSEVNHCFRPLSGLSLNRPGRHTLLRPPGRA